MTIVNGQLISPYDGSVLKSINEYFKHAQWQRDKLANENPGGLKPAAEEKPAQTNFKQAMRDLETQKQARIKQGIDARNLARAEQDAKEAEAKANPAQYIADNLAETGVLSPRSIRKLEQKGAAVAAQRQREANATAAREAFMASPAYQLALQTTERADEPNDSLRNRSLANREYLARCTTEAQLQEVMAEANRIATERVTVLNQIAADCMAARDANVQKFTEAASAARAAQDACDSLASAVEQTGGENASA